MSRRLLHAACAVLGIVVLAACAASTRPAPDETWFRERVARTYVEPFRRGDVETWLEVFAEDAVALHNRRPADVGKAAIRAFGLAVHEHFNIERFDVNVREVRSSGDWVLTRGDFVSRFTLKADGSSPWGEEEGKFVLLWERQDDGVWRILVDMGNSSRSGGD